MDSKFTENLQAGDLAIICGRNSKKVCVVERVTATQIIFSGDCRRFRRKSGRQVGGSAWEMSYLEEATPEKTGEFRAIKEKIELLSQLRRYSWEKLSTEDLQMVLDVLPKPPEEGK